MSIIEKAYEKLRRTEPGVSPDAQVVATVEDAQSGADEALDGAFLAEAGPLVGDSDQHQPSLSGLETSEPPGAGTTHREARLDLDALSAMGMVTPHTSHTFLAEQYRIIKRPLLLNASRDRGQGVENGNLIMVTSAVPEEGKTFTAINLAMSISMELDRRVLLVDADVNKGDVTRTLKIEAVEGLTDYLTGDAPSLSDLLIKTNVPKLTILPAGREHKNITELMASDAMRRFTRELAARYPDRIIIFDTPPLLATTYSRVLASLAGQVVLVVRAETTLQRMVNEALHQLEANPHVGMVLNRVREESRRGDAYYYGYGYGGKTQ